MGRCAATVKVYCRDTLLLSAAHLEVGSDLARRKPAAMQRFLCRRGRLHRAKLLREAHVGGKGKLSKAERCKKAVGAADWQAPWPICRLTFTLPPRHRLRWVRFATGRSPNCHWAESKLPLMCHSPRTQNRPSCGPPTHAPRDRTLSTRRAHPLQSRHPSWAPSPCRWRKVAGWQLVSRLEKGNAATLHML